MNDTKLVKALKAHIKKIEKVQVPAAQAEWDRAVNERAMKKPYWEGVIETYGKEAEALKEILTVDK